MNMGKIFQFLSKICFFLYMLTFGSIADDVTSKNQITDKELKQTEFNVFTGMFDFSDEKQRATLFGFQHQNDELFRKSFLGKLSPITGGFLTENSALYVYTGVQAEYDLGFLTITPSFAPGYYNYGDGKDLGYPLEFKSEVQLSFDLSDQGIRVITSSGTVSILFDSSRYRPLEVPILLSDTSRLKQIGFCPEKTVDYIISEQLNNFKLPKDRTNL